MASIFSQSRGVWLVLPLYLVLASYYAYRYSRVKFAGIVIAIIVIGAVVSTSTVGDTVKNRIGAAVNEVTAFYTQGQYATSLGARLAMWEIAFDVWERHPIVGTGPGDFDEIIERLQKQGHYQGMEVHASTHNIYIQSLVNAGTIGFIALLLAIIIMPMKIFLQALQRYPDRSLTGVVYILLFATLGVGESWTLRNPAVAVYIVFMLATVSSLYLTESRAGETS
jgi:O-antigen ligase